MFESWGEKGRKRKKKKKKKKGRKKEKPGEISGGCMKNMCIPSSPANLSISITSGLTCNNGLTGLVRSIRQKNWTKNDRRQSRQIRCTNQVPGKISKIHQNRRKGKSQIY